MKFKKVTKTSTTSKTVLLMPRRLRNAIMLLAIAGQFCIFPGLIYGAPVYWASVIMGNIIGFIAVMRTEALEDHPDA